MKNTDYQMAKLLPFWVHEIEILQSFIAFYLINYSTILTQRHVFLLGMLASGVLKDNIRLLKLRIEERDKLTSFQKLMDDDVSKSNKFIHLYEELPYISEYLINSYIEHTGKLSIKDKCEYINNNPHMKPYFQMEYEEIRESIESINIIKITEK
jgi:hypothetical protein